MAAKAPETAKLNVPRMSMKFAKEGIDNVWGLSKPVQTFYEFLVPVNAPPGKKKENGDHKHEYG